MMETLRWYSLVAAAIILFGTTSLKAQDPLEQLEAKLLQQEKIEIPKVIDPKKNQASKPAETLPGPAKSGKSLLVKPNAPASKEAIPNALIPPTLPLSPNGVSAPNAASDRAHESEPPYLGMTLEKPNGGGLGLRVVEVVNQSPAWKSGFRVDDRILAIAGNAVAEIDAFADEIAKSGPNTLVKFLVDRRGRQMDINVVLIPKSLAVKTIPNAQAPFNPFANPNNTSNSLANRGTPRVPQALDGRGSLGIVLAPLSDAFRRQFGIPVFRGASVLEVSENSPGFMAGLIAGDCIVNLDGRSIQSDEDVVRWKKEASPNLNVPVSFYRGAQLMQSTIQYTGGDASTTSNNRQPSGLPDITPDMLTPEYIQQLRAEIAQLRSELIQSQNRIQSLERQAAERR